MRNYILANTNLIQRTSNLYVIEAANNLAALKTFAIEILKEDQSAINQLENISSIKSYLLERNNLVSNIIAL